MADELPPIVVELIARANKFKADMAGAQESVSKFSGGATSKLNSVANVGKAALGTTAAAVVGLGVTSIKMAGDFQESMTQLVTGAGESEDNIKTVSQGILDMSGKVGISAMNLSKGMYLIESAGYHGANGLQVLKAASEGARVGGADMQTVADGLTTALTDYKIPADQAAEVTSKLVATVAAGKTHMSDLSTSLATVLPAASAAGVGLDQVLGAMATMTGKGTSAQLAATYLRGTILSLENPTQKQTAEMQAMGLSALDLSKNLGQRGLTGTFDLMTAAIAKHSAAGLVTIDIIKKHQTEGAKLKAQVDAQTAALAKYDTAQNAVIDSLKKQEAAAGPNTAAGQKLQAQIDSMTAALARHNTGAQAVIDQMTKQAAASTNLTSITAGMTQQQQTSVAALANMMGGARNLQAALELTGGSAATFQGNVAAIAKTSTEAGGHVKGFGATQKDLNTQIANLKASMGSLMIELGQKLIPIVESASAFFLKHKGILVALAAVIGGALVGSMVIYVGKLVWTVAQTVAGFVKMIAQGAAWIASQTVALAESAYLWASYTAEWLSRQAEAAGEWLATQASMMAENLAALAEWAAEQAMALASTVAEWAASAAAMAASAMAWAAEMLVAGATALLPFLPIILAAAAVAAAGYLLVTHWKEIWGFIEGIVMDAWHFIDDNVIHPIEAGFKWVVDMVKQHWDLILGILTGPIGLAIAEIVKHWNDIVDFFEKAPGRIASAVEGMWDPIWEGFKGVINWIIRGWNSLQFKLPSISLPFGLGSFGGEDIGVPQLPYLASGGDITQGGVARVGEFGIENVFLPKGARVQPISRDSGGGGGSRTITVEVPVYLDSQQIAKVVTPPVRDSLLKTGRGMQNIFGGTA